MVFKKFKDRIFSKVGVPSEHEEEDSFVELNNSTSRRDNKIQVQFFELREFSDVKAIIDSVREGYTISLVNIAPLKERDGSELKRAVEKIKKTIDVSEGDIKGFGNDWLIVVPSFAEIVKTSKKLEE